jgi:pimeloyl-ACP methyl ester carboxylesterase
MNARVSAFSHPAAATAREARATSFPEVSSVATGAILVHAIDAWVLQVEGQTSLAKRGLLLAVVASAGTLCWFAAGRLSYRLHAIALLASGVVAAVVVGPILGSYISKQGLAGSRMSGVAALLGALVLIAIGTTRLVRSAGTTWRKLLAIPIALVIAQFFLLPVGQAVLVTQAARPPLTTRTPSDLGFNYEDVSLRSVDGTLLAGWYVPSTNGAAVLLRHGSGSTRVNTLDHAAFLAEAGFGVLLVDARGHGDSEGRINELGWHGPQDISASIDHLAGRADVTAGIGILGLSMGGEEAINAAAQDVRIEAIVAEGAGVGNYSDSVATGAHVIERIVNWTQFATTELLSDAPQPEGIVSSLREISPRPVLLITGDEPVEKTMGPVYEEAGESTTLWELPDTPHTGGLDVHPAEYTERVLTLFNNSLLGAR